MTQQLTINENHIGFLVFYKLPACLLADYPDLATLAKSVNLDPPDKDGNVKGYVPTPGKRNHEKASWEKAMNLGAKGIKFSYTGDISREDDIRGYGAEKWLSGLIPVDPSIATKEDYPEVRYVVKEVKGKVNTRQLFRDVYVKTGQTGQGNRSKDTKLASRQLSSQCIMLMEYDPAKPHDQKMAYHTTAQFYAKRNHTAHTGEPIGSHDTVSALTEKDPVTGEPLRYPETLDEVVYLELRNRFRELFKAADTYRIRVKLNDTIRDLSGVSARPGSGGLYFLPASLSDWEISQLNALVAYVEGLARFRTKSRSSAPKLSIVPVGKDAPMFDHETIVIDDFKTQLEEITKVLGQATRDGVKPGHGRNFRDKIEQMVSDMSTKALKFQVSMVENESELDLITKMARAAQLQAEEAWPQENS